MLLCIDIGNTNTVLGVYRQEELISHWRISTRHGKMPDEYAMLMFDLFRHAGLEPEEVGKLLKSKKG